MMTPQVSVIVPNYNHGAYLRQRLESIYGQTYRDFEVIILDDKSTDNSLDIIREVVAENEGQGIKTRIVANDKNTGSPFKQWKKGLELATGEYIWIAESDDWASEMFLERTMDMVKTNGLDLCFTHSNYVDTNGNPSWVYLENLEFYKEDRIFEKKDIEPYLTKYCIIVNASAVVFRRSLGLKCVENSQSFRWCGDWMMWASIISTGSKFGFISEKLNYFRRHEKTTTTNGIAHRKPFIIEEARVMAYMKQHSFRCDISPLLERWTDDGNNTFSRMYCDKTLPLIKVMTRIDKWAAFKFTAFSIHLLLWNIKKHWNRED